MPYLNLFKMNFEAKHCNYSLRRGKKTDQVQTTGRIGT
jgi:hypothetical protein